MEVLLLTVFLSLVLTAFFILSFMHSRKNETFSSPESDALMPLAEEHTAESKERSKQVS